jgi:hypothetical protein
MKYYLWFFCCVLLLPCGAQADVKINEVAWMGTAASQYSEWIELYNNGTQDISLAGWKLYKTGNTLLFTLSKSITAGGYLLIERTTASAPDAVPGVTDESGTFGGGGLRNTGEDLLLTDKEGTAIDTLSFASGWPAGDAKTKDTMQWDGQKWITAPGTPDAANATEVVAPVVSTTDTSGTNTSSSTTTTETTPVTSSTVVPVTTTATSITTVPVVMQPVAVSTTNIQTITVTAPVASVISSPKIEIPQQTTLPKKTVKKKPSSVSSSAAGTDDTANDVSAAQLQNPTDTPQENNHTKIIIFGAVIFIGMALFLLFQRFKAQQQ